MPKFSIAYVKQNPVMFGVIFVVFGLFLWFFLNRRAASSDAIMVAGASGPSDAQVAAATQVQLAQIGAGAQVQGAQYQLAALQFASESQERLAALELQMQLSQMANDVHVADRTLDASITALQIQTDAQVDITNANNSFMVDYARVAQDAATTQLLINAALQRDLSAQQLEGYKFSTSIGAIGSLKKKDRDNALAGILGYSIPNDPKRTGGGINLGGLGNILGVIGAPVIAGVKVLAGTGGEFKKAG